MGLLHSIPLPGRGARSTHLFEDGNAERADAHATALGHDTDLSQRHRCRECQPALALHDEVRSQRAAGGDGAALLVLASEDQVGGVLGCLLALPINGVVTSTTNWASFSEIAFAFRVTPQLLLAGLTFAVVMGVIGGFFPARRASKLPVIQALR